METKRIYTRIVLDMTQDDLPVIESESFLWSGPIALCMPSDGGGGSDGDRGSGGSTDSERESAERGGGSGSIGDFGDAFNNAIEAALNEQMSSSLGRLGLSGAYASHEMGFGASGYEGLGVEHTYDGAWDAVKSFFSDVPSTIMDKQDIAAPQDLAFGQVALDHMMAGLMSRPAGMLASDLQDLTSLGLFEAKDYTPEALEAITPGRPDAIAEIASDLGLTSIDMQNSVISRDVFNQAYDERVQGLRDVARATSYDSMVDAAVGAGLTSMKHGPDAGMDVEKMLDLARISLPEIFGTAMKFSNPMTAVGGLMDLVGYVANDVTTRDILGGFTRGMSVSKGLGNAVSMANMLAGGIPGLDVIGALLSTGAGAVAYSGLRELNREMSPGQLGRAADVARSLGVDVDAGDSAGQIGLNPTTLGKASASSAVGGTNRGGRTVAFDSPKNTPSMGMGQIVEFKSALGTVVPFGDNLIETVEEPWYGNNQ